MYLTRNKGKSVVAEKFIRTLNGKIYKKMTANNSKSYRGYLNKLIDEYSNTYHRSIEIETNSKASRSKVDDRVRVITYKYIFSKGYTHSWSKEISVIEPV